MDAQREPEGPQWFTGMEFAERYKLPRTTADRRLDALFRAGNLERWTGPIKATGRHGHKYRLKQP